MRFSTKASVAGSALVAVLLLTAARAADAHWDRWGPGWGHRYYYAPPPAYYVPPPPVYYAPAPRVYAPAPPLPYYGRPPAPFYAPPPRVYYPPPAAVAPGFGIGLSFR